MGRLSVSFVGLVWIAGCTPTVFVDERGYYDLHRAAEALAPGEVLRITGEHHIETGLSLPDGAVVEGPATLRVDRGVAIEGRGALTLRDLQIFGGDGEISGVHAARDLWLDRVQVRDQGGATAVYAGGSLWVENSAIHLPGGVALRAQRDMGNAAEVGLDGVAVRGEVQIRAERVQIRDAEMEGLEVAGTQISLEDSTIRALLLDGTFVQFVGLTGDGPRFVRAWESEMLALRGGTWELEAETVVGFDLAVDAVGGAVDAIELASVSAVYMNLQGGSRIAVREGQSTWATLVADQVDVEDHRGEVLVVNGVGDVHRVTLTGPAPKLVATMGWLGGIILRSTEQPVWLSLDACAVDGLIVVEPLEAVAEELFVTRSYFVVRHLSWLGGSRAQFSAPSAPVFIYGSLFEGYAFGPIGEETVFEDSALWSLTEEVAPRYGLDIEPPGFVGPADPTLRDDAPWPDRGAFASPWGADLEQAWSALL